jgi:hypothetical protein
LEPATIITTITTKAADQGTITATKAIISELAPVPTIAITIDKGKPTAPGGLMVGAGAVPSQGHAKAHTKPAPTAATRATSKARVNIIVCMWVSTVATGCHNLQRP